VDSSHPLIESETAARHFEDRTNLLRKNTFSSLTDTPRRVVHLSLAQIADAVQHFPLAIGELLFEPLLEERRNSPGQAENDEPRFDCACAARGREDLRISCSVIAGTTGATITPVGTPAFVSCSIASSRSSGVDARRFHDPRDLPNRAS